MTPIMSTSDTRHTMCERSVPYLATDYPTWPLSYRGLYPTPYQASTL